MEASYLAFFTAPLAGLIATLVTIYVSRHQRKMTETADYAAEVFDGWRELNEGQRASQKRLEAEVHQLRVEVNALHQQLLQMGCARPGCPNRIPVSIGEVQVP